MVTKKQKLIKVLEELQYTLHKFYTTEQLINPDFEPKLKRYVIREAINTAFMGAHRHTKTTYIELLKGMGFISVYRNSETISVTKVKYKNGEEYAESIHMPHDDTVYVIHMSMIQNFLRLPEKIYTPSPSKQKTLSKCWNTTQVSNTPVKKINGLINTQSAKALLKKIPTTKRYST